ncbi:hypothetical protein R3W88_014731 [Solanum pinnatisectum]|uniref:Uncharacterized protein n=1 Tax=Solanum pinnatisectum TaxID=50273 RepID=A0AAV9KSU7_9SOLN|nr:hypothetical protein R3W88_014731 [Solanum pinnatisectum]
MKRGQENEGEREKGKANNLAICFISAFRKDFGNLLDFIERLKNEQNQIALDVHLIEALKYALTFICTSVQLSYFDLDECEDEIGRKKINATYIMPFVASWIDDCVFSCHYSTSNATMTEEQLDFLLLNLHYLSKYYVEQYFFPLVTQYEILQNVCGNLRDFHGLVVNVLR